MDTLVLSYGFTPIARVPWHRALTLVLSGRAEVLEEYDDHPIRSAYMTFQMPAVIRFLRKVAGYFRRGVVFNRKNVWLRDKGECQYCGHAVSIRSFTFDHVTPISQGGKTTWENIVVACHACNQKKSDHTPKQAHMALRTVPVKPKSLPATDLMTLWGKDIPDCWKDYFGSVQYWHGALS